MREFVVQNFIRSFFVGVVDVQFYVMSENRNIQVTMNTEEDFMKSFERAKEMKINEIILADKENLMFKMDRDNFETQMYMTAAKGAMEAWTTRFQEQVVAEREEAENNKKDSMQEVRSTE